MDSVACELKYSGAAMAFLLAAFAGTVAVVLATPWPPGLRAAILAYAFAQAARACRALLAPRALRLHRTREIHVQSANGTWRTGTVRDGCFVLPALTVIRWRPAGARLDQALPLLPGMASREELRKIRVILRCS